jgi:transcriptional regulator with XRE-family HTH domain
MTADELKARREALRYTQSEMARALGVSKRTYENWEQARTKKVPTILDAAVKSLKPKRRKP